MFLVLFLKRTNHSTSVDSFVSRKVISCPRLGEADPGGLGACPQKPIGCVVFFFFQKKKQKALFRFAEDDLVNLI
jgi:hypothetical protein